MVILNPRKNAHGASVPAPESAANDPALLKRRQIARAINVSPRTIDNWQKQKKIPFLKLGVRCVRFYLPSVLAALRRFEVKEVK
ncbi:MAG: hypothetical protein H0U23_03160 [Blastocatellia bacterium]|nr:hypothetical protein [Blastocatellia bacterium]